LYSGKVGRWVSNPDYNSLLELDNEVKIETEETLLNRNYCYWCKEGDKRETIKVQKLVAYEIGNN